MRSLGSLPPGPVTVLGRIISFPVKADSDFGKTRLKFHLLCEEIWRAGEARGELKVSVTMPSGEEQLEYGDKIMLSGEISRNGLPVEEGQIIKTSLLREGLRGQILVRDERDCVLISKRDRKNLMSRIFQLKEHLENRIDKEIPAPENKVLKAMLLGSQEGISPELREDFSKCGAAHLLAIAGLHTGLVALIFMAILKFLRIPRRVCSVTAVFLMVGYCIMTGARTSVLRASFMLILLLSGSILERDVEMITSLSWAALLLLIYEPLDLFEPAFQLSFLTVLSILTLLPEPPDQKRRDSAKPLYYIQGALRVSFAAWLGIVPLIAYYFYLVSPIAVLANLFVVPWLGLVISSGIAFLTLGHAGTFFNQTLGASCWWITHILIGACQWFSRIPCGNFRCSPPDPLDFSLFYGLFLLRLNKDVLKLKNSLWVAAILISANIFVWKGFLKSRNRELRITFLNVGHGDSAVIEFPGKGVLLIDAGQGGEWDQGRMTVAPFLWRRGITRLDGILITHPHFDHFGGLKYILKEFEAGILFDNGDDSKALYNHYSYHPGLKRHVLRADDSITGAEGIGIKVLHPPASFVSDTALGPNDQSLVLKIDYKRMGLIMGGDAERIALREINSRGFDLRCQVLKVPHHGSWSKEDEEIFLAHARPKIAVISEAETNKYHLPNSKTIDHLKALGADVFQTGLTGNMELQTDGSTYHLRTNICYDGFIETCR